MTTVVPSQASPKAAMHAAVSARPSRNHRCAKREPVRSRRRCAQSSAGKRLRQACEQPIAMPATRPASKYQGALPRRRIWIAATIVSTPSAEPGPCGLACTEYQAWKTLVATSAAARSAVRVGRKQRARSQVPGTASSASEVLTRRTIHRSREAAARCCARSPVTSGTGSGASSFVIQIVKCG